MDKFLFQKKEKKSQLIFGSNQVENHYLNSQLILISSKEFEEFEYFNFTQNGKLIDILRLEINGKFYAISSDKSVIFIPGKLFITLREDEYQEFGMVGKKFKENYQISINLDDKFKAGNPVFDKLMWCCEHTFTRNLDFQMSLWDGRSMEIDNCEKVDLAIKKVQLEKVQVPRCLFEDAKIEEWELPEFFEWIGLVSIESDRISYGNKVDPFICSYKSMEKVQYQRLHILKLKGLIIPDIIEQLTMMCCDGWKILNVKAIPGTFTWKESIAGSESGYVTVQSQYCPMSFQFITP